MAFKKTLYALTPELHVKIYIYIFKERIKIYSNICLNYYYEIYCSTY